MDEDQIKKWEKVKAALEEVGKTDCYFYKKACAALKGIDLDVFTNDLIEY